MNESNTVKRSNAFLRKRFGPPFYFFIALKFYQCVSDDPLIFDFMPLGGADIVYFTLKSYYTQMVLIRYSIPNCDKILMTINRNVGTVI
jgi:hypothetical protein